MKNFRFHMVNEEGEEFWDELQAADEDSAVALMTGIEPGLKILNVFELPWTTYEYSVCVDCFMHQASEPVSDEIAAAFRREAGDGGHFSVGIEPTEDDPNGEGCKEFSRSECDVCRTSLAGSRHGLTLFRPR